MLAVWWTTGFARRWHELWKNEAWLAKPRSSSGFSNEQKFEADLIKTWALDVSRLVGVNMPSDTRRRIRGSVTSIHDDLETWPRVGADAGEAQKANKHRPVS